MSTESQGYYHKPRWSLWRWLGFGTCHARFADDDPLNPEINPKSPFVPSYMMTETVAVLDWKDRLRILVSGKLMVSVATRTDVIVFKCQSVSKVSVVPPNYKRGAAA
jgi:hypothetical protein